ncbi:extensin-like [Portunus trituberculatus]|uniref:extensin-like n=1 Tax=Portunus trituberculatus TaxID=210409 RepID=UPI001E1CED71|nr:extensin-like [Portunus trituberculatus]
MIIPLPLAATPPTLRPPLAPSPPWLATAASSVHHIGTAAPSSPLHRPTIHHYTIHRHTKLPPTSHHPPPPTITPARHQAPHQPTNTTTHRYTIPIHTPTPNPTATFLTASHSQTRSPPFSQFMVSFHRYAAASAMLEHSQPPACSSFLSKNSS